MKQVLSMNNMTILSTIRPLCCLYLLAFCQAFSPHDSRHEFISSSVLFGTKPKKPALSYAERLQLDRQKKAAGSSLQLPNVSGSEPVSVPEAPPIGLAKQMIAAQRKSLDMLAFVRERVESLPSHVISQSLDTIGFCVLDSFLGNDDVISILQSEGDVLLRDNKMETDLRALGSGEFFATIKGGQEQYPLCPRTIELVVSMTKHIATIIKGYNLSPRNCMATIRTFDRKAKVASNVLVTGSDMIPARPFGIVNDDDTDSRKVTVLYYLVSSEWQNEGGITFEQENTTISAKRDRLIILRSDTCRHRLEAFLGHDGLNTATFLELHFIVKNPLEP